MRGRGRTPHKRLERVARLTEAGRKLLDDGRRLLRSAAELENSVKRVATGRELELRIAVVDVIPMERLFPLLHSYYEENFGMYGRFVRGMPQSYRRMQGGDRLLFAGYEWEVIVGRGHSPEHACLYDEQRNILISGDQVLPTISPNISVWPTEPDADPLKEFFESIDALEEKLPEDVLVLPAHGKPFRGVHVRLEELRKEHADKLDALLSNSVRPRRVVDVYVDLFGAAINDSNRIMATGEAIAHLHYLVNSGDLVAEQDANGVHWFARA